VSCGCVQAASLASSLQPALVSRRTGNNRCRAPMALAVPSGTLEWCRWQGRAHRAIRPSLADLAPSRSPFWLLPRASRQDNVLGVTGSSWVTEISPSVLSTPAKAAPKMAWDILAPCPAPCFP